MTNSIIIVFVFIPHDFKIEFKLFFWVVIVCLPKESTKTYFLELHCHSLVHISSTCSWYPRHCFYKSSISLFLSSLITQKHSSALNISTLLSCAMNSAHVSIFSSVPLKNNVGHIVSFASRLLPWNSFPIGEPSKKISFLHFIKNPNKFQIMPRKFHCTYTMNPTIVYW